MVTLPHISIETVKHHDQPVKFNSTYLGHNEILYIRNFRNWYSNVHKTVNYTRLIRRHIVLLKPYIMLVNK